MKIPFTILLTLGAGCGARQAHTAVPVRGALAGILEPAPSSLAGCRPIARSYAHPFWRAPYQACRDSTLDGGEQVFEVDADSVVISADRWWRVAPGQQRKAWDSEAARLTHLFGKPVRAIAPPPGDSAFDASLLRGYCDLWRGADSLEVTLYLQPFPDVSPTPNDQPWSLVWHARHGPLLGAVSCGSRE